MENKTDIIGPMKPGDLLLLEGLYGIMQPICFCRIENGMIRNDLLYGHRCVMKPNTNLMYVKKFDLTKKTATQTRLGTTSCAGILDSYNWHDKWENEGIIDGHHLLTGDGDSIWVSDFDLEGLRGN